MTEWICAGREPIKPHLYSLDQETSLYTSSTYTMIFTATLPTTNYFDDLRSSAYTG